MTDIFINSEKIDEHFNGARPLETEYEKTVILVNGNGGSGKSTLCSFLSNDKLEYISVDVAMIKIADDIKEMATMVDNYGSQAIFNIHILSAVVDRYCKEKFVELFFEKYVLKNENKNILLDGFIFSYCEIKELFLKKCHEHNIRVWSLKKL
jgi:broad-specificity NMP kinase